MQGLNEKARGRAKRLRAYLETHCYRRSRFIMTHCGAEKFLHFAKLPQKVMEGRGKSQRDGPTLPGNR